MKNEKKRKRKERGNEGNKKGGQNILISRDTRRKSCGNLKRNLKKNERG